MDANAQVYRTEEIAEAGAGRPRRACTSRYAQRVASRTRASGSTPTCSRRSSSASCSTWPRSWSCRRWPATSSRGGHFREDYPTRDDANFMRHTMAYRETTDGTVRLDYKPVIDDPLRADGAEVLMATARHRQDPPASQPRGRHAEDPP